MLNFLEYLLFRNDITKISNKIELLEIQINRKLKNKDKQIKQPNTLKNKPKKKKKK